MDGVMGYLNRIGFFDYLAVGVAVVPDRPLQSGAKAYARSNAGLVEVARVNRLHRDVALPTRLTQAVREP